MKKLTACITVVALFSGCVSTRQIMPLFSPGSAANSEFLYWCKPAGNEDGLWNVYEEHPKHCKDENVSRGQWDKLPITVNAEPELVVETMEAIQAFNTAVGLELFRFEVTNWNPDVGVLIGGEHFYAAAQAKHLTIDGRHHGIVFTYNGLHLEDRPDIIVHELGHIVGLMHDYDNKQSIMFPSIATRVAALEPGDIKALRTLYK